MGFKSFTDAKSPSHELRGAPYLSGSGTMGPPGSLRDAPEIASDIDAMLLGSPTQEPIPLI